MFAEFDIPKGAFLVQKINSFVACAFVGTCALWAALFVWNVTTGTNPIDNTITSYLEEQAFADSLQ
jgi:hypothetical protein